MKGCRSPFISTTKIWILNCYGIRGNQTNLTAETHIRPVSPTVVIVDHDLGFVFWLGHMLDSRGHSALPARTVADAALLIMQLDLKIDVLVINLSLPGAVEFVNAMHRTRRQVTVIGIIENAQPATTIPGVNALHPKPRTIDLSSKMGWINCVEGLLMREAAQGALP